MNYRLEIPAGWGIHPVFHASLLRPYKETDAHGPNFERPPPELDEQGEKIYEVEEILHARKRGRGIQFMIRWKGYPDRTWEPRTQILVSAKDAVRDFYTLNPDAPGHELPIARVRISSSEFNTLLAILGRTPA